MRLIFKEYQILKRYIWTNLDISNPSTTPKKLILHNRITSFMALYLYPYSTLASRMSQEDPKTIIINDVSCKSQQLNKESKKIEKI